MIILIDIFKMKTIQSKLLIDRKNIFKLIEFIDNDIIDEDFKLPLYP